jgi:transcription antitermination factor NusG
MPDSTHRNLFGGSNVGGSHSKIDYGFDAHSQRSTSSTAWFAVQTNYRHENRVSRDLKSKGFETYLPLLRETRQWSDRKKTVEVPAFDGYVFVRHDDSLKTRVCVLQTLGVVRVLGDNHSPVPIPDSEIESLQRTLFSNLDCKRCDSLAVGTMVEVKRGVLAGIRGRLLHYQNSLRLVLSVSTVSQAISVEVNLQDVEPAAEDPLNPVSNDMTNAVPLRT